MFLEFLILQHMDIPWMMVSQDKRVIVMEKHTVDLLKVGPVYSLKACRTRKDCNFEDYLNLVRTDKRALKSEYRVITEYQSDFYSVDSVHRELQSKYTDDTYHAYCCVRTFVSLWCTKIPLLLLERQEVYGKHIHELVNDLPDPPKHWNEVDDTVASLKHKTHVTGKKGLYPF